MNLLDRLLKRIGGNREEESHENLRDRVLLKDILFDWFKDSEVEISFFEKEFFDPCLAIYKSDERLKNYFSNYPEQFYDQYFDQLSILFLTARNPSERYLRLLFDFLLDKKHWASSLRDSLKSMIRMDFSEGDIDLYHELRTGQEILKAYHAIHDKRDVNFSYLSQLSYSLGQFSRAPDDTVFSKLLEYITVQEFEELPAVLINAFPVVPGRKETASVNETSQVRLRRALHAAVNKYNAVLPVKLDERIIGDFLNSVLQIQGTPIFRETEHKKRKYLSVKDFPDIQAFLRKYDQNEYQVVGFYIYYLGNTYISIDNRKLYKEFAKKLTKDMSVSHEAFGQLLKVKINHSAEFIIKEILAPIFKNIEKSVSTESQLLEDFEKKVVAHMVATTQVSEYQAVFDLITGVFKRMENRLARSIYENKYNGLYAVADFQRGGISLSIFDSKSGERTINNLVQQLRLLFPASLKGMSNRGSRLAVLNLDGQDHEFSTSIVEELNQILGNKKVGYRFIPVPFAKFERYGQTWYHCSLGLFNHEQFCFYRSEYLNKHFPELSSAKILDNVSYERTDSPIVPKIKDSNRPVVESTNSFAEDPSWKWFREGYIDQLSGREQWYDIMEQVINSEGVKKPKAHWQQKLNRIITQFGKERFFKELGVLMTKSLREEFWFLESYRPAIKGIIWSCSGNPSDESFAILKSIIETAYQKIPGIGPKSAVVGNLGMDALVSSGETLAYGILSIMRNKSKYQRFVKAIDKYLEKFQCFSDEDPEALADRAVPKFGFSNGVRRLTINDRLGVVYRFRNQSLYKRWIIDGEEVSKTPDLVQDLFTKEEKEITAEFKRINKVFRDLKSRIETFWRYDRTWQFEDWEEHIFRHPLLASWIDGLIWKNETMDFSFMVRGDRLLSINNEIVTCQKGNHISLWHPANAQKEEIGQWQRFLFDNSIVQPLRQAFREHYPFSETELQLTESGRFSHHFLVAKKLMAIASSTGWTFTYAHYGENWPRKFIKALDVTVHLKCDYHRGDFAIPTKELFFTTGDTVKLDQSKNFERIPFRHIPAKTRSEVCRDIDLFISVSSIANDPTLSLATEEQRNYRRDFEQGDFSDNASAKIRKQVIKQLIPALGLRPARLERNFLMIQGKLNSYRINLGSGFAQIDGINQHINLLPDISPFKKNRKIHLPIQDDETLYIILAKALFLQNDDKVQDEKIKRLLEG